MPQDLLPCVSGGSGLPAVAGGAAVGWFATAQSALGDADKLLKADKPLKQKLCDRDANKTGTPGWVNTWCAWLPENTAELAVQWVMVGAEVAQ